MSRIREWLDALKDNQDAITRWAAIALVANAALVGLGVELSWAFGDDPPPPPDHWTDQVNESLAEQVVCDEAEDFIKHYLETTQETAKDLQNYLTFDAKELSFIEKPPGLSATARCRFAEPLDKLDPAGQRFTAVVRADAKDPGAPAPERYWFQVSLLLVDLTARVQTPPSWIAGPVAGLDMDTAYRADVASTSPAYTAVRDFLAAYTLGGDIRPWTTTDDAVPAPKNRLGSLVSITVTATATVPDRPPAGAEAHVFVVAQATTIKGAPLPLSYQMDLQEAAGRWTVAALEDFPLTEGTPK